LAGPIRIGLHAGLSACARRHCGHDRNRENGAERSMHTRFPLGSMIGSPLPAIKPPRVADAAFGASFNMSDRTSWDATR
jgi:hypothetical protein